MDTTEMIELRRVVAALRVHGATPEAGEPDWWADALDAIREALENITPDAETR